MPTTDPRVDAYIARSAEFAKPILERLRKLVHKACPDVTETIKWNMPFFEYKGSNLCMMSAFKQHVGFGLWKAPGVAARAGIPQKEEKTGMGDLGRLTSVKDLPPDKVLLSCIAEAIWLKEVKASNPAGKAKSRNQKYQ